MSLTRNYSQRNSSWNAPYTFSGKEKDAETGYGYFGARYYDSGLSIWLSVDPMSDKYPSMSPYNYCANNPVMLVDPDGEDVYIVAYGAGYLNSESQGQNHDVGNGFKKNAEAYANSIKNREGFDPAKDIVILVETKSTEQLINATNTEYDQGQIAELTIFIHGYDDAVSLGGQTVSEVGATASNQQLNDYDKRELNENTMTSMNISNFKDNATISFFGCNIGGYDKSDATTSFAQTLADYMGGNRTIQAFTGGAEFTSKGGKNTYDGRMIRSQDRKSQLTKFTTFQPFKLPVFP